MFALNRLGICFTNEWTRESDDERCGEVWHHGRGYRRSPNTGGNGVVDRIAFDNDYMKNMRQIGDVEVGPLVQEC